MKSAIGIALFISVMVFAIYAATLRDSGVIKLPLSKRRSAYQKRGNAEDNIKLGHFADTDTIYYATIKIAGQQFQVAFDTGSYDLWVPGISCSDPVCINHNRFDPSKSATFEPTDKNFTFKYHDGKTADVDIGYDTVSIGGKTAKNQVFGVAKAVTFGKSNLSFDGIMGMGPGKYGQLQNVTLFHQLIEQGAVKDSVFGIYFDRINDSTSSDSEVTLGGVDTSKFTGDLVYNNLVPNASHWQISLDDLIVNGSPLGFKDRTANIDTGTSYITIPETDLTTLNGCINGNIITMKKLKTIEIPCNMNQALSLKFANVAYKIKTEDLIFPYQNSCILGFFSTVNSTISQWIVGDTFLRNVYSVFNISGPTVGFAQLVKD